MIDINLVQIITAAGADPSDVTDAIWNAGYRKPARSDSEAAAFALTTIAGFYGSLLPQEYWPTTWDDILLCELNDAVIDAITADEADAISVTKELSAAGYTRVIQ